MTASGDDRYVSGTAGNFSGGTAPPGGRALLGIYDDALPAVYGYLIRRTRDKSLAEDLTSETFLAAMDQVRRADPVDPSIPWLIGIARHKLADHWRRMQRTPIPVEELPDHSVDDQWDVHLDRMLAEYTLLRLSDTHRAVLTLRYVDDCTVAQCAELLDRTVTATEALLTRAKRAFRASYPDDSATSAAKGGRR